MGGRSLRYVAEVEGQWVALLMFSGAAPHTKAREQKIGWTPRQRARRLCWVVNNSRFLVLPERQRYPNLASRVLALALKRLSADWQQHWGHPVILVESYVDESQYRGTCYRACGFEAVGLTAGYGRSSRDYYCGARPAQAALSAGTASARHAAFCARGVCRPTWPSTRRKSAGPVRCGPPTWARCWKSLKQFKDQRRGHGLRHRQPFVLACAAVAMLMGAGGYEAFEDECRKLTPAAVAGAGLSPGPQDGPLPRPQRHARFSGCSTGWTPPSLTCASASG